MATIGNKFLTFSDWAQRADPDKKGVARIVESLEKKLPILGDIPAVEGNLDTGHQVTGRLVLPTPTYRGLNEGVDFSASQTDQYVEVTTLLESKSAIDIKHPGLRRGGMAFRASEDDAHAMGFAQEVAAGIFYNSIKTSPTKFHGLTPRMNVTSGNPASGQIIKAYSGASGNDQSSIWLIGWSPQTVYGIFPPGAQSGFKTSDEGILWVPDRLGKDFRAWVTVFNWEIGVAVEDYRYLVRICNIDNSAWAANGTDVGIAMAMEDAIGAIFSMEGVDLRFYMNRTTFTMFNKQLQMKSSNLLEWHDHGGHLLPHFHGIPIRISDSLLSTEAVVT